MILRRGGELKCYRQTDRQTDRQTEPQTKHSLLKSTKAYMPRICLGDDLICTLHIYVHMYIRIKNKASEDDTVTGKKSYIRPLRKIRPAYLKVHRESKHEGVRYPCNECEFAATAAFVLKRHKESKHEGVRYPCNECEYAGTTKGSLKVHKESKHAGVKYPCEYCKYAATSKRVLVAHKRRKHALLLL